MAHQSERHHRQQEHGFGHQMTDDAGYSRTSTVEGYRRTNQAIVPPGRWEGGDERSKPSRGGNKPWRARNWAADRLDSRHIEEQEGRRVREVGGRDGVNDYTERVAASGRDRDRERVEKERESESGRRQGRDGHDRLGRQECVVGVTAAVAEASDRQGYSTNAMKNDSWKSSAQWRDEERERGVDKVRNEQQLSRASASGCAESRSRGDAMWVGEAPQPPRGGGPGGARDGVGGGRRADHLYASGGGGRGFGNNDDRVGDGNDGGGGEGRGAAGSNADGHYGWAGRKRSLESFDGEEESRRAPRKVMPVYYDARG